MKPRYHYSISQFPSQAPAHRLLKATLSLLFALLIFFLLPGLLAAQEQALSTQAAAMTAEQTAPADSRLRLGEQAVAATIAAAQPAQTDAALQPQPLSRELRTERLWLLPRHAKFIDHIRLAGEKSLQHPDCNEVLYGTLNEFKTERIGTSFTILCMKDARTTFNQVFFAADLVLEEPTVTEEDTSAIDELERLRRLMAPQSPRRSTQPANPVQPEAAENLPAPVVF